jgi:hypothetical protein
VGPTLCVEQQASGHERRRRVTTLLAAPASRQGGAAMTTGAETVVLEVAGVHWASSKSVAEAALARGPGATVAELRLQGLHERLREALS